MEYKAAILIDFLNLNAELKKIVLNWRNSKFVAENMVNKEVKIKEHLRFLKSLKYDKTRKYYLVTAKNGGGCDTMLGL